MCDHCDILSGCKLYFIVAIGLVDEKGCKYVVTTIILRSMIPDHVVFAVAPGLCAIKDASSG